MPKNPSRIDLLELDIDLRLADLWREAYEIGEWKLDVVAAFIRAAYGKGYCDALTEERPGSLCQEHGYRVPARRRRLRSRASAFPALVVAGVRKPGVSAPESSGRQLAPSRRSWSLAFGSRSRALPGAGKRRG